MKTELEVMLNHFIIAALGTETDENDNPLDSNFSVDDVLECDLEVLSKECEAFLMAANSLGLIDELPDSYDTTEDIADDENHFSQYAMIGHDFLLTRNGHGVGFWDRDLGKTGDQLTKLAEGFGTKDAYVGAENNICFC